MNRNITEADHLAYADYFINGMQRYAEFQGKDLNSHTVTHARYHAMLDAWKEFAPGRTLGDRLTRDQILAIVNVLY